MNYQRANWGLDAERRRAKKEERDSGLVPEPVDDESGDEYIERTTDALYKHRPITGEVRPPRPIPTEAQQARHMRWISYKDWRHAVPAARCRECGNVTWKLSLSGGPEKLRDTKRHGPVHKPGCSKPPGRLDRKYDEV